MLPLQAMGNAGERRKEGARGDKPEGGNRGEGKEKMSCKGKLEEEKRFKVMRTSDRLAKN